MFVSCKGCIVLTPDGKRARVTDARIGRTGLSVDLGFPDGTSDRVAGDGLRSGFAIGNEVRHCPTGQGTGTSLGTGTVEAIRTLAGYDQVSVQFHDTGRTLWLPFEHLAWLMPVESRLVQTKLGREADHADRFRLRTLSHLLQTWDANTGAFGRLDIDPLPHQLHVARRVVSSGSPNWLIADDVGLGKTIEVGLVLHALEKRGQARRVLIVCPASLTRQWKEEMAGKFGRSYEIYGLNFMPDTAEELRGRDRLIVSIDLAKREKHLALFRASGHWDMVVFDEAHHLGRNESGERTERFHLAEALRPLARGMLLLTATPHQGRSGRFRALLELVRPDLKQEIAALAHAPEVVRDIVIRNDKTRVTYASGELIFRGHDTHRYPVTPTPAMAEFDEALRHYLRRGYGIAEKGRVGQAVGFVMTVYRKLASSSLEAIRTALHRRLARLDGIEQGVSVEEFVTNDDIDRDMDSNETLRAAFDHAAFFADERATVAALVARADALRGDDAKIDTFLEEVLAPTLAAGNSVLVFTEYRATQSYVAAAIAARFPDIGETVQINGSMKLADKITAVEALNTGESRIMVSTEAGAEGLNMQRACHVMVNYDLPWNPSRLVQRIGRLYRYGQTKRVQVLNLQMDDGFDSKAIGMMLDRVERIAEELSAVITDNREALEAQIMGELLSAIDMEAILKRAHLDPPERTAAEVEAAIADATTARGREADFLSHADGHDGTVLQGIDARHMMAFFRGMAPHLDIAVRGSTHDGRVVEVVLPERLVGRWPEMGRRSVMRMTATPSLVRAATARGTEEIMPVDFDNPLLGMMIDRARMREFDGLMAATPVDLGATALCLYRLRWQNAVGTLLEEEIVPVAIDADGRASIVPMPPLAEHLLVPLPSAPLDRVDDRAAIDRQSLHRALRGHWRAGSGRGRMPGAQTAFAAIRSGSGPARISSGT